MKHKLIHFFWIALFPVALLISLNCQASITTTQSLAPMLEKIMPAIVNIRAQYRPVNYPPPATGKKKQEENNEEQPKNKLLSIASGVIVDAKNGYILTNNHAVEDAQTITVILSDGRHYTAKIIGTDKPTDIALIQIKAKNLTAIPIADSNQLKVGDAVAAIGNPFGLTQSVTSGIISALGRTTLGVDSYENFIQTDAPINPGNSGGALINMSGQLIGINSVVVAPTLGSGIGFAIPSNMAKSIMEQLIEYGNVRRGALGVGAQDITPELATAFDLSINKGAVVTLVMKNSPAEKAGLEVGDVITNVNGAEIKSANDVVNAIAFLRVDSKANIKLLRNNKSLSFSIHITDPQKRHQESESKDPFLYGVALKDFTLLSPIHGDVKGILVADVEQESNAWHADLRPGDVIVSADKKKVTTIEELKKVADKAKDTLLLNVLRGPGAIFLLVTKEPI